MKLKISIDAGCWRGKHTARPVASGAGAARSQPLGFSPTGVPTWHAVGAVCAEPLSFIQFEWRLGNVGSEMPMRVLIECNAIRN